MATQNLDSKNVRSGAQAQGGGSGMTSADAAFVGFHSADKGLR